MNDSLSLGISPCPNDTFTFDALVHGRVDGAPSVETSYADIDVLNQRAQRGELDIVKVSYGALPWLLDDYALLTSGGALGRGCGPLLLTLPDTNLDLTTARVAVPGLRTTAYLLFRLWARWSGAAEIGEITVLPFEQIMPAVQAGTVDAGLVIHESRFTYPGYGLVQHVDLGEAWEQQTGLAIPLGAILARRSLGAERIAEISGWIRDSVEQAWKDPATSADYIAAHAQEMDPDVQAQHIALYVNEFTRTLGSEGAMRPCAASSTTPPRRGSSRRSRRPS